MKITAITRYKHGQLWAVLQRLGWSQTELARRTGLTNRVVGFIMNLVRRPTEEQANAIQQALGAVGEYFDVLSEWPETFQGLKPGYKVEQTEEVEMERLLGCREALQLPAPESGYEDDETFEDKLNEALSRLSPKYQIVIRRRFWHKETLKQIGEKINLSPEQVRVIECRAIRTLRGPAYMGRLWSNVDWDSGTIQHDVYDPLYKKKGPTYEITANI